MFEMGSPKTKCIGVASGKGGVGKSTVTVNLALSLQRLGFKVGVMDIDVYGPSIRKMLPEDTMPQQLDGKLTPALSRGIKVISMAHFRQKGEAIAVRAPIATGIVRQFVQDVEWGQIDYLLIDFPPGTGDVQLTIAQSLELFGALLVTTPQEVALLDVERADDLFTQVGVPVLGIIENMSYLTLPDSNEVLRPFGRGGGKRYAEQRGIPLLGEIPIESQVRICSDRGTSLLNTECAAARIFEEIATAFLALAPPKDELGMTHYENFGERLEVYWRDGEKSTIFYDALQKMCPCAACAVRSSQVDPGVHAQAVELIGKYALRFVFRSGCSQGIYPFELLRKGEK